MSQRIHDTNKGPCSCAGGRDDRDYPSDPDEAGCTDVFCLLFFAIYWIGILGVGIASISTGDLSALFYGADYLGNRCGVGAMQGKKDVWCVLLPALCTCSAHALVSWRGGILDRRLCPALAGPAGRLVAGSIVVSVSLTAAIRTCPVASAVFQSFPPSRRRIPHDRRSAPLF
jgi:hypothetical protein